jgi:hypothetical protein
MARFSGGTGPTGPTGLQGPEGPMGYPGEPGVPGLAGADGLNGEDGQDGQDGLGYSYSKNYLGQTNTNDPINFSTLEAGSVITSYDFQPEAFSYGDKVKVVVDGDTDNLWLEGYVFNRLQSEYDGFISIFVERWNESSTYATPNPAYSIHLIGAVGADGLGYDWKVAEPFDSADFNSSTMILFSDVGFGAYAVGNYVRYYVNPDEDPLGWVEGEIEDISSSALLLSVKSWSPEAEGMEGQIGGTRTIAPYMTLIGRPGANGTPGSGYDYTYPFDLVSGSGGMPGNYEDGTPFYVNASITIPALGAYRVGNFVRFYPNPDADPAAWVEGQITDIYFSEFWGFDWFTISLNNGTPSAAGMFGVDGSNYTIAPYMTLIGEKGDSQILQSLRYTAAATAPFTYFGQLTDSSISGWSGDIFDPEITLSFNKISSTSAIEVEFDIFATLYATVETGLGEMN